MSAIPALDVNLRPAPRTTTLHRPTTIREIAPVKPRRETVRVVSDVKTGVRVRIVPSVAERVATRTLILGCIAAISYVASSLTGQVMLEKARHEEIRALVRAESARKMETALRSRLDDILRPDRVEAWALGHGFVPRDAVAAPASRPPTMVAMREP